MLSDPKYKPTEPPPDTGRNHLLLIGIDQYQHWPVLDHPVKDCQALWDILREQYGFSEENLWPGRSPLYNEAATARAVYHALFALSDKSELGEQRLGAADNLIIYFAGHGFVDAENMGHLIPVDAPLPQNGAEEKGQARANTFIPEKPISVAIVKAALNRMEQVRHIVLMVDGCYPQAFARMEVDMPPAADTLQSDAKPESIPSRWILTSGRMEKVSDRSPFAEALQAVLRSHTETRIAISVLGAEVRKMMERSGGQIPWYAPLTPNQHDGGEFYFHCLKPAEQSVKPEEVLKGAALAALLRNRSTTHRQRLMDGRFKMLRIERLLLTETNLPDFVDAEVKVGDTVSPLEKAVYGLWGNSDGGHALLLGDGGMGKTVSLLKLWEDLLNRGNEAPIPLFVALNEYNAATGEDRVDFIRKTLLRHYAGLWKPSSDWQNALWELLQAPRPDGTPAFVLLLDGFNEVTAECTPLLTELNRLRQEAPGLQLVVTSRYFETSNFTFARDTEIVDLLPLEPTAITVYLEKARQPLPENGTLQALLGNPMMLTIYASTCHLADLHRRDSRFRFLPVGSMGELLWNFTEAQLAKYFADLEGQADEQAMYRFLMRYLLPYLGWRMEKEGIFFLPKRPRQPGDPNFHDWVNEGCAALHRPELSAVFPEVQVRREWLGLGYIDEANWDKREDRAYRIEAYLVEKLHLLVSEGDAFRFAHQNFRDFFAACHLLNVIDLKIPEPAWTQRALPVYLRRMVAEIEGEHHYDPQKVLKGEPMPGFEPQGRLAALLDKYRGIFHDEDAQRGVMNVVRTMADGRGALAGADLSILDLQKVYLNGIALSAQRRYRYLPMLVGKSLMEGKLLFAQEHSDIIRSVCYSPDGKKILSGAGDGTVKEWSVETGECLQTLEGHSFCITSVCYSPDGEKILSGAEDETIKEWLVETGKCLQTLQGHYNYVLSVCYSPDGEKILSGSRDKTVKEWLVETGECLQTLKGHYGYVNSVCYSLDGKKILSSGSGDGRIKEWSVKTGECLQTIKERSWSINSVCYCPDGRKILSGYEDGTIREWSAETGECLQTVKGNPSIVTSLRYSPDRKKILAGSSDEIVKEWSIETGECLQTLKGHSNYITSVCYSPDGKKILSAAEDQMIKEWSVETGECLQTLKGHSNAVLSVGYSPEGKKILSGYGDGTVKEWAVKMGQCLQSLKGHSEWAKSVCHSPEGKKILSGYGDGTVKEWSVETGECLQILKGHSDWANSVCYSPDGQKILSGGNDHTVKEWSIETGECLQTLKGHSEKVTSVCYRSDGKRILSGSLDGTVKEWLVDSGGMRTMHGYFSYVTSVCYSPDEKKILSGYGAKTVKEWSAETGECLQTLKGHSEWVTKVCYSPDGERILSGYRDGTVKEWSVETGECLQTLQVHSNSVNSICYSWDGTKILSGSLDGTIKEWSVQTGECLQTLHNEPGLYVQGIDLTQLHPDSTFTKEEKEKLRQYGAIFSEEDRRIWEEAIAEARKTLDNKTES